MIRRSSGARFARRLAAAAILSGLALGACGPKKSAEEIVFWQFSPPERIQPLLDRF